MAWQDGFVRDVFPALQGDRPLTVIPVTSEDGALSAEEVKAEETSAGACACGKRSKQECCKGSVKGAVVSTTASPSSQEDQVSVLESRWRVVMHTVKSTNF